jgi:hypothetical protein
LRASSMGACDDDTLMTVEHFVVGDEQYVIHKRMFPSEEKLRQEVIDKVAVMDFDELKSIARQYLR